MSDEGNGAVFEKLLSTLREGEFALLRYRIGGTDNPEKEWEDILFIRSGLILFPLQFDTKTAREITCDEELLKSYASIDASLASPEAVPFFRELAKPENGENFCVLLLSAAIADLKSLLGEEPGPLKNYTRSTEAEAMKYSEVTFLRAALMFRGNGFAAQGNYEKAIDDYSESLKIQPENPRILYSKGHSLTSLERYEEAITCLSESLEIEENQESLLCRGACYVKLGSFDNAEKDSEQLLRLDPLESEYHILLGDVKFNSEDYQGAIQVYSDYIHLLENNHIATPGTGKLIQALEHRSVTYQKLNMLRESAKDQQNFQMLQEQVKKTCETATRLFEESRFEELLPLLEPLVQDYPQNSGLRRARGWTLLNLERYDEAMNDANYLIAFAPQDGRFWELKIF